MQEEFESLPEYPVQDEQHPGKAGVFGLVVGLSVHALEEEHRKCLAAGRANRDVPVKLRQAARQGSTQAIALAEELASQQELLLAELERAGAAIAQLASRSS